MRVQPVVVLRDPYDRYTSKWGELGVLMAAGVIPAGEFPNYMKDLYTVTLALEGMKTHLRSQYGIPIDPSLSTMQMLRHAPDHTRILRYEHLAADWQDYALDYNIPADLPRLNVGPAAAPDHTDRTREYIQANYQDDIAAHRKLLHTRRATLADLR